MQADLAQPCRTSVRTEAMPDTSEPTGAGLYDRHEGGNDDWAQAWYQFCASPPHHVARLVMDAFWRLTEPRASSH